jgi:hypothetical protein
MSTDALPVLEIAATVGVLAVVQSLFGVGLLLFGTPVLLLLGVPFELVLAYLLPCSITVSALQVFTSGGLTLEPVRRRFLGYAVPAVLVATAVAIGFGSPHQLRTAVGIALVLTALLRLGPTQRALTGFVRAHTRPLMVVLGVVHGLSNLGGGILTVIAGANATEKTEIRRHIAFAYGAMASVQLAVVLATARPRLNPLLWLGLPVLAGSVYLLIGQRVFARAGRRTYQHGLTGMIASFGVVVLASL